MDFEYLVKIPGCVPSLFQNLQEHNTYDTKTKTKCFKSVTYIPSWKPYWFIHWLDGSVSWQNEADIFTSSTSMYIKLKAESQPFQTVTLPMYKNSNI